MSNRNQEARTRQALRPLVFVVVGAMMSVGTFLSAALVGLVPLPDASTDLRGVVVVETASLASSVDN